MSSDTTGRLPESLAGLSIEAVGEKYIAELVRLVVDRAGEAVRERALAELDLPVSAAAVARNLAPVLQWGSLSPDRSISHSVIGGHQEPEAEPVPATIDSWARGAVPSKPLVLKLPCTPPSTALSQELRHDEPLSLHTKELAGPHDTVVASKHPHKERNANADADESATTSDADGPAWRDGLEEGGDVVMLAHHGTALDPEACRRRREERAFLEGLRLREDARIRDSANARERECVEAREATERATRLEKELKGREWVWGFDGEILIVDRVPPERVPTRVVPHVAVRDPSPTEEASSIATSPGRGTAGTLAPPVHTRNQPLVMPCKTKSSDDAEQDDQTVACGVVQDATATRGPGDGIAKVKKEGLIERDACTGSGADEVGPIRKAGRSRKRLRPRSPSWQGARRPTKCFFEMSSTFQPPLLDSLELQPGVVVQDGSDKKEGPPFEQVRAPIPHQEKPSASTGGGQSMSRADYSSKHGLASTRLPLLGSDGAPVTVRDPAIVCTPISPPATFPLGSLTSAGVEYTCTGRLAKLSARPAQHAFVDTVKTLDPLAGATRAKARLADSAAEAFGVGPDDEPCQKRYSSPLEDGSRTSHEAGGGIRTQAETAIAFRPVPPPPVPHKPSLRHRRAVVAQPGMRRLRDRGSRLMVPAMARKRLPPPPVGETMGHGLSPPRSGAISNARHTNAENTIGALPPGSDAGRKHDPLAASKADDDGHTDLRDDRGFSQEFPPLSVQACSRLKGRRRAGASRRAKGGGNSRGGAGWIDSRQSLGTLQQILVPT